MISNYFLNSKVKKLQKKFEHQSRFLNYGEVQKVVLLFDFMNLVDVQAFAEQLKKDGKEVFAYSCVLSKKTIIPVLPDGFALIKPEDVTLLGEIQPVVLEKFRGIRPDTLIDLTIHPHAVLQILSLSSEAVFRSGLSMPGKAPGDLLLEYQEEKTMDFLLEQLHFYLRTLHSK